MDRVIYRHGRMIGRASKALDNARKGQERLGKACKG